MECIFGFHFNVYDDGELVHKFLKRYTLLSNDVYW